MEVEYREKKIMRTLIIYWQNGDKLEIELKEDEAVILEPEKVIVVNEKSKIVGAFQMANLNGWIIEESQVSNAS